MTWTAQQVVDATGTYPYGPCFTVFSPETFVVATQTADGPVTLYETPLLQPSPFPSNVISFIQWVPLLLTTGYVCALENYLFDPWMATTTHPTGTGAPTIKLYDINLGASVPYTPIVMWTGTLAGAPGSINCVAELTAQPHVGATHGYWLVSIKGDAGGGVVSRRIYTVDLLDPSMPIVTERETIFGSAGDVTPHITDGYRISSQHNSVVTVFDTVTSHVVETFTIPATGGVVPMATRNTDVVSAIDADGQMTIMLGDQVILVSNLSDGAPTLLVDQSGPSTDIYVVRAFTTSAFKLYKLVFTPDPVIRGAWSVDHIRIG